MREVMIAISAAARSMQGIGRRDDLRIPHPGPEALIGQDFVQKATRPQVTRERPAVTE
jgi:hypothetical protein